jgi:hypothetical protein
VPLFGALRADRPFLAASSGYAGTSSDGLSQLDANHTLGPITPDAPQGNVVQTAQLDRRGNSPITLALGYGQTAGSAIGTAGASARTSFASTLARYAAGWVGYDARLKPPPLRLAGLSAAQTLKLAQQYYLSVNVVKASEDKTFPGAIAPASAARGARRSAPATCPAASPTTSGPTARSSPATCTRRSPGCWSPATPRPRRRRPGSCSSASSWPTAGCRATRCPTARRRRTPAATSWTSRRTRS